MDHEQSIEKTLRRLFLTLFLRGRSSRGLNREKAPGSIAQKLWLTLTFYGLAGLLALAFVRQPIFALAAYLHAMTFIFVGMFIAASSGEILFNKEEAEILLHRPVMPSALLRAKMTVLMEVSLWMAGAFNLTGLIIGVTSPNGSWLFPLAHAVSTTLEALFCTSFVVVAYQLCLRWFGRERLDGLMTTVQVFVSIAAVLAGQILPRILFRAGIVADIDPQNWWIALLPPAWFAGIDDTLAGRHTLFSLALAVAGIGATAGLVILAYKKLAQDYESGLQKITTTVVEKRRKNISRRWTDVAVNSPPLRWWLRDPAERAAFVLSIAYMLRDRDVKLRLYPGVAPIFVVPIIFALRDQNSGFMIAFSGAFLAMIPMMGLSLLRFSQQWQASDLFRLVPLSGPAALCHGARRATIVLLGFPAILLAAVGAWLLKSDPASLWLLLPGLITLPVYSLIPCRDGDAVPLSHPIEEAKSAGRGLLTIVAMFFAVVVAGIAYWAQASGWLAPFIIVEVVVIGVIYVAMRRSLDAQVWKMDE